MAQMKSTIISYESSKWYVKVWRQRWYLYAIFLHIITYLNPMIWLEHLLGGLDDSTKKKLRSNWRNTKKDIELSKMYKFSTKYDRED